MLKGSTIFQIPRGIVKTEATFENTLQSTTDSLASGKFLIQLMMVFLGQAWPTPVSHHSGGG